MQAFGKYSTEIKVLPEPVAEWKNMRGVNLLDQMYRNPARTIFPFQIWVHQTNLKRVLDPTGPGPRIIERLQGARAFSQVARDNGYLDETQASLLHEIWDFAEKEPKLNMLPDLYIYMKVSPATCLQRIRTRNRPEEGGIDIRYLTALHNYHQSWLNHGKVTNAKNEQIEVIVVDGERDINQHPSMYEDVATCVMQRVRHHESVANLTEECRCGNPLCCGLCTLIGQ